MRVGVIEHLGIAQAPAWLFAAELREGAVLRLLTPFDPMVPILAVRPTSRRLSTKVRIFIEHLEKTFALCSQFNPLVKLWPLTNDQAIAASIRASAAFAVALTASRFPKMPAVEYAPSINMSNWLLSTSG
jgi:hypothetical protein